jgi:hypothetical protein
MPRFPVKAGVAILPFEGIGLVRQKAETEGAKVVVTIEAGGTLWRQTWSEGALWWDEAAVEYRAFSWGGAWAPGPYDVDPGWSVGQYRLRAVRTTEVGEAVVPSSEEIEKGALQNIFLRPPQEELRRFVLGRLEKYFSGEELGRLQVWHFGPEYGPPRKGTTRRAEGPVEQVQPVASDPRFEGFVTRLLCRHEGMVSPTAVRAERQEQRTILVVSDINRVEHRLTLDGQHLESRTTAGPEAGPVRYQPGERRIEIGRRGETTFCREADRIFALGKDGRELWRHQVPANAVVTEGRHDNVGLPLLSSPQLVRWKDSEFIICGIGQRTVQIGMGISYQPAGGGVLALGFDGKVMYDLGKEYCEELLVVDREQAPPMAVGLFARATPTKGGFAFDHQPFLAAVDATTCEELWRADLPVEPDRYHLDTWDVQRLRAAVGRAGPTGIILSTGDTRIFGLDGKALGMIGGFWTVGAADFDSDGELELVGYTEKPRYGQCGRLGIASASLGGRTLWTGPPGRWECSQIVDLDGDGWMEILAVRVDTPRAVAVFGKRP